MGAVHLAPRKEEHMKSKDLKACLASFKLWQADEALDLGQKEALQRVARQLRKLSRHTNPSRYEVLKVVRMVTEVLWKAYSKK